MKKRLARLLTLAMLIGCMAGCGPQTVETEAPTKAPEIQATAGNVTEAPAEADESDWLGTEDGKSITLRLWGGVQPEYGYDELVANFNEEYKDRGLQVEYVRYVNDTEGNLQVDTYLMSGGEIDVLMGYGKRARMDARVDSNLLLNMTDMLKERDFDLYEELGEANMTPYEYPDGSIYGFPTKYENGMWMLINVDMFQATGIEIPYDGWTYSEFLAAIEKLTTGEGQDKVYGVFYGIKQDINILRNLMGSVLGSYANYKDDAASAVNYDHEIWKESLELVKTSMEKGWAIPIEDEYSENLTVANTFVVGKSAISLLPSQMRLVMDTDTYPHDFVTAIVPGPVPDGDEYNTEYYRTHSATTGAGDLIHIAARTEYPEQCFEFVMWYLQGGMTPLAKGGRIPLWNGIDKTLVTDVLKANAEGTIDMDSMEIYLSIDTSKGINTIASDVDTEVLDVWKEEFEAMCYGRQTIEQTVDNRVSRANALLK